MLDIWIFVSLSWIHARLHARVPFTFTGNCYLNITPGTVYPYPDEYDFELVTPSVNSGVRTKYAIESWWPSMRVFGKMNLLTSKIMTCKRCKTGPNLFKLYSYVSSHVAYGLLRIPMLYFSIFPWHGNFVALMRTWAVYYRPIMPSQEYLPPTIDYAHGKSWLLKRWSSNVYRNNTGISTQHCKLFTTNNLP